MFASETQLAHTTQLFAFCKTFPFTTDTAKVYNQGRFR